jgi:hypothetical protein
VFAGAAEKLSRSAADVPLPVERIEGLLQVTLRVEPDLGLSRTRDHAPVARSRTVSSGSLAITTWSQVLDETLESREGGWTRDGRVYRCSWIAAHPVEATKAGVSCNSSGDNGTTPRQVPERSPAIDLALGGFVDHYRSALASGAATRVGESTVDGRDVVWLRIPTGGRTQQVAIDSETFQPVRVTFDDGRGSFRVALAETVPYDPARFKRPERTAAAALVGNPSSETPIEPGRASALLGGSVIWLGEEWRDLRLERVTWQERPVRGEAGSSGATVTTVKLSYARVLPDGSLDDRAVELYEPTLCLVRVGWTCTPRDPTSPGTVGQPVGDMFALLRRDGLYIAIWASPGATTNDLLVVARALQPVEG